MKNGEKREAVLALYRKLIELNVEQRSLEKEQRQIKEKLAMLIPSGGVVAGVKRVTVTQNRVSWKEVAESSKATLIPRTRWDDFQTIVESQTKETSYDKFSEEEV